MIFVGIDPGKNGGIGIIDAGQSKIEYRSVLFNRMKDEEAFKFEFAILGILIRTVGGVVGMEKVHAMPPSGRASMFTFGQGYGLLRMCLEKEAIPYWEVPPLEWQTDLDCRTGGNKNITKVKAKELFPDVSITHGNADSLLIAKHVYRRYTAKAMKKS